MQMYQIKLPKCVTQVTHLIINSYLYVKVGNFLIFAKPNKQHFEYA